MGGTGRLRALRLAPFAVAVAIGLLSFLALDHHNANVFVTDDGIRDQLLVRDCTDLGRCHLIGARTSLPGIHQGAVWLDLLIGVRLLGGDSETQRRVVVGLLAVGVATACVVVWRWLAAGTALVTAALLLAALFLDQNAGLLINPSVAVFPDVLIAAALLCYVGSGRRVFLVAAAFAAGVAINVHVAAISLLPALLLAAALVDARPVRALAAAALVVLATCLFTSSAALLANLQSLASRGWVLAVLAAAAVLLLPLLGRCGAAFRRRPWPVRAALLGVALVAPFLVAALWLRLASGHPFTVAYLHPVLAPAATIVAAALTAPFAGAARRRPLWRWLPSAAALALFLGAGIVRPALFARAAMSQPWSLDDAARLAAVAQQAGWSYADLGMRLQGIGCHDLLSGMAVAMPPAARASTVANKQLQVVKLTARQARRLARHEATTPLASGDVAVVREIDSWMRPAAMQACRHGAGAAAPQCVGVEFAADERDPRRFLFSARSFPDVHKLDVPRPYTARYQIPVLPEEGGRRQLMLAADAAAGGWRITGIEGVQYHGTLPSARVELFSDNGHPGMIVVEREFGLGGGNDVVELRLPPCLYETAVGDKLVEVVGPR